MIRKHSTPLLRPPESLRERKSYSGLLSIKNVAYEKMLEQFEQIGKEALTELEKVSDLGALEEFRIKYLARKGQIIQLLSRIGQLPPDQKPKAGQIANRIKKEVTTAFDNLKKTLEAQKESTSQELIDVTLPGIPVRIGKPHVITQTLSELLEIFGRMGFGVAYGPEVEDEWHNFIALNIGPEHPARDPSDNFYIDDNTLLRSQTSTIQIRVMERTKPPIRLVAPGRVYRPDTVDATHLFQFFQVEGLMVGEDVTFADLKAVLDLFARSFYGPETRTRFRPHFFPFTEPSAEMDVFVEGRGWMEILGCGMVDPNVFEAVGYDPERFTGFAFGMGVERIAMRKYGIEDIRLLVENDVRFLEQF